MNFQLLFLGSNQISKEFGFSPPLQMVDSEKSDQIMERRGGNPMCRKNQYHGNPVLPEGRLCKNFCVNGLFSFLNEPRGFSQPFNFP